MKIEEEFGCSGYFGFGTGIAFGRIPGGPPSGTEGYCNSCPQGTSCWKKHQERARRFYPDLMRVMDELIATGLRGPELLLAYSARVARETGDPLAETTPSPDLCMLGGNMEDGARVACGLPPKDHGRATLRLPFES